MSPTADRVETRTFLGRTTPIMPDEKLSEQALAGLRQFSLDRLMGYGLAYSDAIELRGRVAGGASWRDAALAIAEDVLATCNASSTMATTANVLYRGSATTRAAQMMMIEDTDERHDIFRRAAGLFNKAATITGDCRSTLIDTTFGPLCAWIYPPSGEPIGTAILIGGIEGWAMDFGETARWLAARGIETWAVDGPGQGESRLFHRHYMHKGWRQSYRELIQQVHATRPALPLAFVGNSLGGTLALEVAAIEPLVEVCCSNGGPGIGGSVFGKRDSKIRKKRMMSGPVSEEEAEEVWANVNFFKVAPKMICPVLIVHGELDPLIPNDHMRKVYDSIGSADKRMVLFSDGDHCVYNHSDDKHALMSDWIAAKLVEVRKT